MQMVRVDHMTLWQTDESGAIISDDGLFRYLLWRKWTSKLPLLTCCMLNPSTANAYLNDPTVRKVIWFAGLWHFGGVVIVNAAAFRTTKPTRLFEHMRAGHDIIGPHNWAHQVQAFAGRTVLVAWGANIKRFPRDEVVKLRKRLALADKVVSLGTTFEGYPMHPLYQPKATQPVRFQL